MFSSRFSSLVPSVPSFLTRFRLLSSLAGLFAPVLVHCHVVCVCVCRVEDTICQPHLKLQLAVDLALPLVSSFCSQHVSGFQNLRDMSSKCHIDRRVSKSSRRVRGVSWRQEPWQVETWTNTCGLPLLFSFEPLGSCEILSNRLSPSCFLHAWVSH